MKKKIRPAESYLLSLKQQDMVARIRMMVAGQEHGYIGEHVQGPFEGTWGLVGYKMVNKRRNFYALRSF